MGWGLETHKYLQWIREKSAIKRAEQMKEEIIMLGPETGDGFRATTGALLSLGEGEVVSFHNFPLPES
jgi:hypothetical protein